MHTAYAPQTLNPQAGLHVGIEGPRCLVYFEPYGCGHAPRASALGFGGRFRVETLNLNPKPLTLNPKP